MRVVRVPDRHCPRGPVPSPSKMSSSGDPSSSTARVWQVIGDLRCAWTCGPPRARSGSSVAPRRDAPVRELILHVPGQLDDPRLDPGALDAVLNLGDPDRRDLVRGPCPSRSVAPIDRPRVAHTMCTGDRSATASNSHICRPRSQGVQSMMLSIPAAFARSSASRLRPTISARGSSPAIRSMPLNPLVRCSWESVPPPARCCPAVRGSCAPCSSHCRSSPFGGAVIAGRLWWARRPLLATRRSAVPVGANRRPPRGPRTRPALPELVDLIPVEPGFPAAPLRCAGRTPAPPTCIEGGVRLSRTGGPTVGSHRRLRVPRVRHVRQVAVRPRLRGLRRSRGSPRSAARRTAVAGSTATRRAAS